jgi:hypothetical protein
MSVAAAAIVLAGTFAAHAQFTEGDIAAVKAHHTHHSSHRMRTTAQPSTSDGTESISDSDLSIPRLPSVFRNCEYPIHSFCRRL